jgi:hypothetical protein
LTTGLALSSGDLRVWLYTGSEPGPGRAPVDFNALRERAVASNAARCPVLARDDLVAWMLTEGATLGGLGSAGWVVDLAGALDGADEVTVPRAARSIVGPTDGSDGRLAERSVAVVRALAVGGDRAAAILSGATVEPAPSPHLPWGYLSAGAGSVGDRARLLGAAALDRGPASTARWLAGAARRRIRARTRGRGGDRQIAAPAR